MKKKSLHNLIRLVTEKVELLKPDDKSNNIAPGHHDSYHKYRGALGEALEMFYSRFEYIYEIKSPKHGSVNRFSNPFKALKKDLTSILKDVRILLNDYGIEFMSFSERYFDESMASGYEILVDSMRRLHGYTISESDIKWFSKTSCYVRVQTVFAGESIYYIPDLSDVDRCSWDRYCQACMPGYDELRVLLAEEATRFVKLFDETAATVTMDDIIVQDYYGDVTAYLTMPSGDIAVCNDAARDHNIRRWVLKDHSLSVNSITNVRLNLFQPEGIFTVERKSLGGALNGNEGTVVPVVINSDGRFVLSLGVVKMTKDGVSVKLCIDSWKNGQDVNRIFSRAPFMPKVEYDVTDLDSVLIGAIKTGTIKKVHITWREQQ